MTPGIRAAEHAGIRHSVHTYKHDPAGETFGTEAALKLGVAANRVFKTLVVALDTGTFAVGVIPVSSMLSMKRVAAATGAKKAVMAARADAERLTGYVLGGISPLGQKRRLATVIDTSARHFETVYVSAGRRGLEIELAPDDLKALTAGTFADLCQL